MLSFLKKRLNKRLLRHALMALMLAVGLQYMTGGLVSEALAQVTGQGGTGNNTTVAGDALGALGQGLGGAVAALATLFIKLISGILYFVLRWMGPLMDNTFILEGDIGLKIRTVWVIIRNFVNIFFALALVGVALMSVIGYGDEGGNYALKKFIPKMALALIAVNFTFLACRIVLDVNNVITTAIFSIPQSITSVGTVGPSGLSGQTIFKRFDCLSNKNLTAETNRTEALQKDPKYKGAIASLGGVCFAVDPAGATFEQLTSDTNVGDPRKQAIISLDQSQFTKKDFIWVMATQFQGIHDLNKISVLLDPTFSGLTVNALFSAVFAVVYATAYISMFIILIARMAVLWVTIMLSPLAAITIVFPDLKIQDFDIKEEFLKHAFVPAKMALPMALGYIMLSQMSLVVHSSDSIFSSQTINISGGEFARGVSFTTLIYGAASVAVLWMGVFSATKGVVGEGIVTSFSDTIKSIGKTVAKWPTYIPLVPVSGGVSLQNLRYTVDALRNNIAEQQDIKDKEVANKLLGDYFPSDQLRDAMRSVTSAAQSGRYDAASLGVVAAGATNRQLRETLETLLTSDRLSNSDKRRLATHAGYSGDHEAMLRDVRAGRNDERIKNALSASLPRSGGGGGGNSNSYASVVQGLGAGVTTSSTNIGQGTSGWSQNRSLESVNQGVTGSDRADFDSLPEAVRNSIPRDSNGALNINNMTAEGLASALKNNQMTPQQRAALIRTNIFSLAASQRSDIRGAWAGDPEMLRRMAQAVVQTNPSAYQKVNNIRIREAFQAIFQKQRDEDLAGLGPAAEVASRIGSDGTVRAPSGN